MAIPQVGVLDMLRYLLGYSPLHNVRPGVDYPATLVMTGERDDRVASKPVFLLPRR